ncbi:MAG: ROK family protein [Clostridia bacterium]|nr:ROK family protein [Clostridia bacterium]
MIGFDIGGTKCSVSHGEFENGEFVILDKRVIPTDVGTDPYVMIDRMYALAREMTDDTSVIGISCGGPLDSSRGVIIAPPNLHGWLDVEIVDYLKSKYGARSALQNDANACALAEWKFGAGKGCQNMVFLTFGTGLGAGLILNGRLYEGTSGCAGEVGHIRLEKYGPVGFGKAGSFEGFCSGAGIAELGKMLARERLQMGETVSYCKSLAELDTISAKTIADSADRGNRDAADVYALCGKKLGEGLSVLIDILNPECIVIGSIFERSEDLIRPEMEKAIKREALSFASEVCRVVPAKLGNNIGDWAALAVAATLSER